MTAARRIVALCSGGVWSGADPDGGSGGVEWMLVAVLTVVAVLAGAAAVLEHRARPA